ncbi:O-antigen ligase family protein [Ketobacter sp. MCCC 1A13808]|nr:O-antigen ligase family protein [Ketobacter sp. MCCC 1A13808]
MELTLSQIYQIGGALVLCFVALILSYRASEKFLVSFFVLLIPFQIVDTRYATLNVVLAFLFSFFLYLRKSLTSIPLLPALAAILFCYFLSLTQVHPVQNLDHIYYLIALVSSFLSMALVYNFVLKLKSYEYFFNLVHVLNVLVLLYNVLQMWAGDQYSINLGGGISFSIVPARTGDDLRLAGPFGSTMPGLIAEYLVISILLICYDLICSQNKKKKPYLILLTLANLGCLIATGNRGGLIGLILFFAVFLMSMSNVLGVVRVIKLLASSLVLFVVAAVIVVNYTSYNRLFDRLEGTEIEGGVPDTRSKTWPAAIKLFEEKPLLGHGPRLNLFMEKEMDIPDHTVMDPPPHNLYLFILCTVGLVGLSAYVIFFLAMLSRVGSAIKGETGDVYLDNFPKLATLLILYFLFDQIKIEYLRYTATDYWQYAYMLFGFLLALSDKKKLMLGNRQNSIDSRFGSAALA